MENHIVSVIKQKTCAYVQTIEDTELASNGDIIIDISRYKYADYETFLIYILKDQKLLLTCTKENSNKSINLKDQKTHKLIYDNSDLVFVILPVHNRFSRDVFLVESIMTDNNDDMKTCDSLFSKIVIYFHLALPFLGLLLLSSFTYAYSLLFQVPTDYIDVSSQIQILYNMVFEFIDLTFTTIFDPVFYMILFFLFMVYKLIQFNYRNLWGYIRSAPKFCINIFYLSEKTIKIILIGAYAYLLLLTSYDLYKNVKNVIYEPFKAETFQKGINKLLNQKNNHFFDSLITYNLISAFPMYIQTKDNKYLIVKAVKDDTVIYQNMDDLFDALEKKYNEEIKERICGDRNNNNSLYTNFMLGMSIKSNIGQTSILNESKNANDYFKKRAEDYKEKLCNENNSTSVPGSQ